MAFDEKVAHVDSLLNCGLDVARDALSASGSDISKAIHHIYSQACHPAGSSSSSSCPIPRVADAHGLGTSPKRRRSEGSPSASELELQSSERLPSPTAPQPQKYCTSEVGKWAPFDACQMQQWTRQWKSRLSSKNPMALTLRGHSIDKLPEKSKGKAHKKEKVFSYKHLEQHFLVKRTFLKDRFEKLLENVRFPPSSLKFSWRIVAREDREKKEKKKKAGERENFGPTPRDLKGSVPRRPFRLVGNSRDALAAQPPHFTSHPLRKEQLQSLAWMIARESTIEHRDFAVGWRNFFSEGVQRDEKKDKGKKHKKHKKDTRQTKDSEEQAVTLDLEVTASYNVMGGILGDKIGFGKTATMIGLIDTTLQSGIPEIPEIDCGSFIPARGTLIIVPSNLYGQWLEEIGKFVWKGSLKAHMQGPWSPEGCPLKIFAMSNVQPLTHVKARELAQADVVLCTYRLLYSQVYTNRRSILAPTLGKLVGRMHSFLVGQEVLESGRKGECVLSWEDLQFPLLEMFYWRRVVFDEFHETESFQSAQQQVLQHIRAHYRWGLTGTPPVASNADAIFMSSLFRIDLPGCLVGSTDCRITHTELAPWEGDKLLTQCACDFVSSFIRQNVAELPEIRLEEHHIIVGQTASERALYLGLAHDAPDLRGRSAYTEDNMRKLEVLLQVCSHFQTQEGEDAASAPAACARLSDRKQRALDRLHRQMTLRWRILLLLQGKTATQDRGGVVALAPPTVSLGSRKRLRSKESLPESGVQPAVPSLPPSVESDQPSWYSDLLQFASELEGREATPLHDLIDQSFVEASTSNNTSYPKRFRGLDKYCVQCESLCAVLGCDSESKVDEEDWMHLDDTLINPLTLQHLIDSQLNEQRETLKQLQVAQRSLDFFKKTLAALEDSASAEARSCSICLDDDIPLSNLAITKCAHTFCIGCLKQIVEAHERCSICRCDLQQKDVQAVSQLICVPSPASSSSDGGRAKYGSKLEALVNKLQELRTADPTAKVLLFVQFDTLKRKVAAALAEFSVPCASLAGSVAQRVRIIDDWQNNAASQTFVLMLSLSESASGANLTAASHVVFLHPMLAATRERAVIQEAQAIGRARRCGQIRDAVHVWRFVTADTIEQVLTDQQRSNSA